MQSRRAAIFGLSACLFHCALCRAQAFPTTISPINTLRVAKGCGSGPRKNPGDVIRPQAVSSSGVAEIDENIHTEIKLLNDWFEVEPKFYFADDSKEPGAYTFRDDRGESTIAMGVILIRNEMKLNPRYWVTAVIGILAHEWAHALQYKTQLQDQAFLWETHADYLAGWYLGSKKASGLTDIHSEPLVKSLYEKGSDKGFYDPNFYGEPADRVRAMLKGFDYGNSNFVRGFQPQVRDAATAGYIYVARLAR